MHRKPISICVIFAAVTMIGCTPDGQGQDNSDFSDFSSGFNDGSNGFGGDSGGFVDDSGGGGFIDSGEPGGNGSVLTIPVNVAYEVTIQGTAGYGNTAFLYPFTSFTPATQFNLPGFLLISQPLDPDGISFNNGINAVDVGLFTGSPAGSPQAGAIWFGTNTGMTDLAGIGTLTGGALLDVAYVTAGADNVDIRLDGAAFGLPAARSMQLNIFNVQSGFLANVFQILDGSMQIQFFDGGATLFATATFYGSGFIEPSTSYWQANIYGTIRR